MSELVLGIQQLTFRRTFLSWLHFAVVLGGLAVGLLNFGDKVRRSRDARHYTSKQCLTPPGWPDLRRHVHCHR